MVPRVPTCDSSAKSATEPKAQNLGDNCDTTKEIKQQASARQKRQREVIGSALYIKQITKAGRSESQSYSRAAIH